jgi:hypothetical protein
MTRAIRVSIPSGSHALQQGFRSRKGRTDDPGTSCSARHLHGRVTRAKETSVAPDVAFRTSTLGSARGDVTHPNRSNAGLLLLRGTVAIDAGASTATATGGGTAEQPRSRQRAALGCAETSALPYWASWAVMWSTCTRDPPPRAPRRWATTSKPPSLNSWLPAAEKH